MNKLILLWGLPGSGKSTYAKEMATCSHNRVYILDVDKISKSHKGLALIKEVTKQIALLPKSNVTAVIDGLFTTNEQAKNLLDAIKEVHKQKYEIEIVFWREDREACLHNDRGRRQLTSEISIKHLPFEEPAKELLEEFNIKLVRNTVKRKENWKVWVEENGLGKDQLLTSTTWSLGGNWCDYNGGSESVSADPQPTAFKEFDELLERICPTITFLQYKRLYNNTVEIESYRHSDYYGGSTTEANFVCDLEKLYQEMVIMGIIKDEWEKS